MKDADDTITVVVDKAVVFDCDDILGITVRARRCHGDLS